MDTTQPDTVDFGRGLGTPQAAQELDREVTATATSTARLTGCED